MKKFLHILLIPLLLGSCSNEKQRQLTINEKYPGKWLAPNGQKSIDIGYVLGLNNITGCGEYYYKWSEDGSSSTTYLVACTRAGDNWSYYKVNVPESSVTSLTPNEAIEEPNRENI